MPYSNVDHMIIETLRELVAQGRLTGEALLFDGYPLEVQEDIYRPDGWSIETVDGCRSHRLVNEAIEAYSNSGDKYKQEAAANFPHLFTFNHARYPEQASDNQEERDLAIAARNRWFSMKWLMSHRNPIAIFPFHTRDGYVNDNAAVVLGLAQPNLPEIAPAVLVGFLEESANNLRRIAERDPNDGGF